MSNELDETREDDIEILEAGETEPAHDCGSHELHEAAAEYLTEISEGDFEPGEIAPDQHEEAHRLSREMGYEGLQNWLHDEVAEDLQKALDRAGGAWRTLDYQGIVGSQGVPCCDVKPP